MPRPGMRFQVIEKVLVLIHSYEEPSAVEWDAFIATYDANISDLRGLLVYSPGPGPDTHQRRRIADINQKRSAPIAVVTPSRVARGIVTALSWFGLKIKAFEPGHMGAALDYLKLDGPARVNVQKIYDTLFRSLCAPSPESAAKA